MGGDLDDELMDQFDDFDDGNERDQTASEVCPGMPLCHCLVLYPCTCARVTARNMIILQTPQWEVEYPSGIHRPL